MRARVWWRDNSESVKYNPLRGINVTLSLLSRLQQLKRASEGTGLTMAVLTSTVASAVGLTQVYLPKGRRPPRDVRPSQFTPSRTVVFTPLKPEARQY